MGEDIFVLVERTGETVQETAAELLGKARELAAQTGGEAVACLLGSGVRALADELPADRVLYVDHPALEHFLPEAWVTALATLVSERDPTLTLVANSTVGMDVAGALSGRTGKPIIAYCSELRIDDGKVIGTSQVFGGKLSAECEIESGIASVLAGSFEASEAGATPEVEEVAAPAALEGLKTRFIRRLEPEAEDVDITAESVLVSVGRGIGSEANIEIAEELAGALGGVVSASRPITDSGWMAKTRQVGKSGVKVKPRLYIACGISGAPEHLEGMRDAELIIAINTDENAPIFDVAHYGTTEDLFELLPALTERIEAAVGA